MSSSSTVDKNELARLCRENGVVYAGLFGSQARGEVSPNNDVNLHVRFPDRQSLVDLARIERQIEEALGRPVDLVAENAPRPYLRDQVKADLEVLVDDE